MATGYFKETDLTIREIDITCVEDQKLLYDVILFRWKYHDVVNMSHRLPHTPPTYEEHIRYLSQKRYKNIYRVLLDKKTIGVVYFDKQDVFSIFLLPELLKKAMKGKKFERNNKKKITTMVVHKVMERHPDIPVFYVGINVKNTASLNAAKELNCFTVGIEFGCKNIFAP